MASTLLLKGLRNGAAGEVVLSGSVVLSRPYCLQPRLSLSPPEIYCVASGKHDRKEN